MYCARSQTISHWIPPITCSGRCDFFLFYRWENWGSGSLYPQPLSSDLQTVWFQSLCFFLPHQSVLKREQVWFWWKQPWICPSAFRAYGSIPGDKHSGKWNHWRHTRLPSCLLCSRANFVLHALVSGHPHFVWPWLSLPQQSETLGPSWYPTSLP